MHRVHQAELLAVDLPYHNFELLCDESANKRHRVRRGHLSSEGVHRLLIVNQFSLFLLSLIGLELASHACVSYSNLGCQEQRLSTHLHDQHANGHHHGVEHAEVSGDLELAVLADLTEALEHVLAWDAYILEGCPAVVLADIADL